MKLTLFIGMLVGCMVGFAGNEATNPIPKDDKASIESFFKDFITAFNANDAERVKRMSGKTWEHWSKNINGDERISGIDIVEIKVDNAKNVVAKITVAHGEKLKSAEVIFTLMKIDDNYCIGDMVFPDVEKRNSEFLSADNVVEKVVAAINARDMNAVKIAFTFNDAKDFEKELSLRGLQWIKNAIDNGAKAPLEDGGVHRERNGMLVGRIYVPCASGGTNVMQRFVFKDGKIDRAAPRTETLEERKMRREKRQAEMRHHAEERKAERDRLIKQMLERQKSVK